MKTVTKLWIGIAILALLSPLGLIIPALFGAGGAWGEWSVRELEELFGSIPAGMQRIARLWSSPMPDYGFPGEQKGLLGKSVGYMAAAVIGVVLTALVAYLLAKLAGRRNRDR